MAECRRRGFRRRGFQLTNGSTDASGGSSPQLHSGRSSRSPKSRYRRWPCSRRKVRRLSPLEEDGFELPLPGRGEFELSPLFSRRLLGRSARSEQGTVAPRVCPCELPKRSTAIPNHGWIVGRTHVPHAGARERQLV